MVADIVRDSALGQAVRYFTHGKVFKYQEEEPGFTCPSCYKSSNTTSDASSTFTSPAPLGLEKIIENDVLSSTTLTPGIISDDEKYNTDLGRADTEIEGRSGLASPISSTVDATTFEPVRQSNTQSLRPETLYRARTISDLEAQLQQILTPITSQPMQPVKTEDGTILVTWYTTDDQANPQNWSSGKKATVTALIMLYTTAVYMGGSIYAPAELGVIEHLGVSLTVAQLGLSLYVLGYGLGPLLWSPLSEIPAIGRNPIYIATFVVFTVLAVGPALVNNIGGLLVLRFLMGFFGSPALATGGATLQDMYSLIQLPYLLSLWALAACLGPAVGPVISGFSVSAENWHYALWEILWLAGPSAIILFAFLPETNPDTILLTRARRLRAIGGNNKLKSRSEIEQANLSPRTVAFEALWKPLQLNLRDPAIAFTSIYTALMYSLFYSFFEAFPLTYTEIYHFNLGETGLAFLSTAVGFGTALIAYWAYLYFWVNPRIRKNGLGPQEDRLIPALLASTLMPIGMFIFGWTAREDIHWIVPSLGVVLVTFGVFIVFQCIFVYLPMTYPAYAASLFAGNDVARSSLAAAAILYSTPLYKNLGIGMGSSLLASLMSACVVGVWILWYFGARLREKSHFAAK